MVTVLEGAGFRQNIGKLLTVKPLHTGREVHSRSTLVGLVTGTVCSSSKNREVSLVVPHEVDGSIAARNDWRTKLRFGEARRPQQRTRQFVPPRAFSTSEMIYQQRSQTPRVRLEKRQKPSGFTKDLRG